MLGTSTLNHYLNCILVFGYKCNTETQDLLRLLNLYHRNVGFMSSAPIPCFNHLYVLCITVLLCIVYYYVLLPNIEMDGNCGHF